MNGDLHVGIDFDDTLVPTRDALFDWFNRKYGTSRHPNDSTEFRCSQLWGYTGHDFRVMFTQQERYFHDTMQPYPHAAEVLADWARRATLHVITARPPEWIASAESFLRRHGLPVTQVCCADGEINETKAACAARLGLSLFIDDSAPTAQAVADQGIDVLLLDRPYNQGFTHPRVTRVRDWREIAALARI